MWQLFACINWGIKLKKEYNGISLDYLIVKLSGESSEGCEEMQNYSEQELSPVITSKIP